MSVENCGLGAAGIKGSIKSKFAGAMLGLAIAGLSAVAAPASAELLNYSFSGTFTGGSSFLSGENFSGAFGYDTNDAAVLSNPGFSFSVYNLRSFSIDVLGTDYVASTSDPNSFVKIQVSSGYSTFEIQGRNNAGAYFGFTTQRVTNDGPYFSTTDLPLQPQLLAMSPGSLSFFHETINGGRAASGYGDAALAAGGGVPEPATWAMMIGGFGMAGAMLRRRRSQVALAA